MTTIEVKPLDIRGGEDGKMMATSWRVRVAGFTVAAIVRDPLAVEACLVTWQPDVFGKRHRQPIECEDQYAALWEVLYYAGIDSQNCNDLRDEWECRQDYLVFTHEVETSDRGVA